MSNVNSSSVGAAVKFHISNYFARLEGEEFETDLYDCIINEVEKVLLTEALEYSNNVQSKAARILGMNRNTLRKKVKELKITI